MIRVKVSEPSDAGWKAWVKKAEEGRDRLLAAARNDRNIEIEETLYKERKEQIFGWFHGKCAYCETLISANQPGDVEHFRPKGRVTDAKGRPIEMAAHRGKRLQHQGYFWLAYDWRNLLPACALCNRPNRPRVGPRFGKWDQFPVRSFRAIKPGDEAKEKPLLLHPIFDEPAKHFVLDESGIIGGRTDEGRECIRVFGLNRDPLPDERRKCVETVQNKFELYVQAVATQGEDAKTKGQRLLEQLSEYMKGTEPYSAFGRMSLASVRRQFHERFEL